MELPTNVGRRGMTTQGRCPYENMDGRLLTTFPDFKKGGVHPYFAISEDGFVFVYLFTRIRCYDILSDSNLISGKNSITKRKEL